MVFILINESRKLGEVGFKRSGEECKAKFEEESTHFDLHNLFHLPQHTNHHHIINKPQPQDVIINPTNTQPEEEEEEVVMQKSSSSKRKRRDKLEKFKGFCEAMVSKMMLKQEQLHNKLIQDMIRRDEEKIAREEAWRNQELDRITTQIQIRTNDHKSAADRQATIIHFLKHFTTSDQIQNNNNNTTSNSNSNSTSSTSICKSTPPIPPPSSPRGEAGKRWPRDEVVALINLRCKMSGVERGKGPLWERISQGMMEMGYKRSGKRCKEKWENINKYFRKTKHSSKKRSLNSRTCPYFHQLACLYNDATILAPAAFASSEIDQ